MAVVGCIWSPSGADAGERSLCRGSQGSTRRRKSGVSQKRLQYLFQVARNRLPSLRSRSYELEQIPSPTVSESKSIVDGNNFQGVVPTKEQLQSWRKSMVSCLSDKLGFHMFMEFLRQEHAEENLSFWCAVCDFERMGYRERAFKAKVLYKRFLAPGADDEINTDFAIRTKVEEQLETAEPFLFEEAKEAVFLMMKHGSYMRFMAAQNDSTQ